ncbi:MAG: poly-beta-hydroxybutyrate polymerase [Alphaproteobacteria bacterium]|nr:MAG: poly-beta-hydroxybutyrate polymerase [Alphaproteobacteria bacterium]
MSDDERQQIRTGPHPLALHVASATQNWMGAAAAFPLFQLGGLQLHPDLTQLAGDLQKDLQGLDLEQLQILIMHKAQSRLSDTLAGLTAYQKHPYRRHVTAAPLFHQIGTTEVRDYGTDLPPDAPVVLAIPSLVNPAYILDLKQDHSFMRFLAGQGIHPYLLDWTTPGDEEQGFGLEDYILNRLIPLIHILHRHHNRKIHLLGYCMGGNLSLAAAQILQKGTEAGAQTGAEDILESLTLIATPWDFHASQPQHISTIAGNVLKLAPLTQKKKTVPMNIMQLFFFSLDPTLSQRKFRKFSRLDPESASAHHFVAIEDWANDGADLPPSVARDCLINWYQQNQPHRGCWNIAGQTIDPGRLTLPGHIILPQSDRIVPPASAKALQKKLPHFCQTTAPGGHVTMIAGLNAKTTLWHKIASYLK